jgi:DNA-binding NarL/FixJ family response regulator
MTGTLGPAIRLAIVDRQRIFAETLAYRLGGEPGMEVVLTQGDTPDTRVALTAATPDVILLDAELANETAFHLASAIRQELPHARLVFMTDRVTNSQLEQALRLEACGILSKSDSYKSLLQSVTKVAAGETAFSPQIDTRVMFDVSRQAYQLRIDPPFKGLTDRQVEILRHLARGESVKCVARRLQLSPKSVDGHKFRIMNKLGVRDKVGLALYAVREGLIEP